MRILNLAGCSENPWQKTVISTPNDFYKSMLGGRADDDREGNDDKQLQIAI